MTARTTPVDGVMPFLRPFSVLIPISLTVQNAGAFSDLLSGLGLHLSWSLTWHQVPDVRWIEGYNAWCGRWAAAQSRPGPPIE